MVWEFGSYMCRKGTLGKESEIKEGYLINVLSGKGSGHPRADSREENSDPNV